MGKWSTGGQSRSTIEKEKGVSGAKRVQNEMKRRQSENRRTKSPSLWTNVIDEKKQRIKDLDIE